MAELIIKHSGSESERISLERLKTTIGRSTRSDICIPDPFASRVHAEIRREGDCFFLHDFGSANGTRYNGHAVKEDMQLSSGDKIQIGESVFEFSSRKLNQAQL